MIDKPITWSSKDTRETQEQIYVHNQVYLGLCGESK